MNQLVVYLVPLVFICVAVMGLMFSYVNEPAVIRRRNCFVWSGARKGYEMHVIEYLAGRNMSGYCHPHQGDTFFNVIQEDCSMCERVESFWKHVRSPGFSTSVQVGAEVETSGKTVCALNSPTKIHCNVAMDPTKHINYDECKRARTVVYESSSEPAWLCAWISSGKRIAVGEQGRLPILSHGPFQ